MPDASHPASPVPARPAPTRTDLLARWTAARRRRDTAPLDSAEARAATIEVGEIEVAINALDVHESEGRDVVPAHRDGAHHS